MIVTEDYNFSGDRFYGYYLYSIINGYYFNEPTNIILSPNNANDLLAYNKSINYDDWWLINGATITINYIDDEHKDCKIAIVDSKLTHTVDVTNIKRVANEEEFELDIKLPFPSITVDDIRRGFRLLGEDIFEYSGIITPSSLYVFLQTLKVFGESEILGVDDKRVVCLADSFSKLYIEENSYYGTPVDYVLDFMNEWHLYNNGEWEEIEGIDDMWDNENAVTRFYTIIAGFLNISNLLKAKFWLSAVRHFSTPIINIK